MTIYNRTKLLETKAKQLEDQLTKLKLLEGDMPSDPKPF
jgi:hypothetical protein